MAKHFLCDSARHPPMPMISVGEKQIDCYLEPGLRPLGGSTQLVYRCSNHTCPRHFAEHEGYFDGDGRNRRIEPTCEIHDFSMVVIEWRNDVVTQLSCPIDECSETVEVKYDTPELS